MGREWDPDARLYYVRNRWYDPEVGGFVSEDPIGLAGGINVYVYAANDPINARDPYGLETCQIWYKIHWVRVEGELVPVQVQIIHNSCGDGGGSIHVQPCSRDESGFCITYIPRRQWEEIGRRLRRIPDSPDFCAGVSTPDENGTDSPDENGTLREWVTSPFCVAVQSG